MKAVILAGGFGKRLRPLTDDRAKPMIEILGVPILEWQINWLQRNGIKEVVICVGHQKETVLNYIGSGQKFGVHVGYAVEEEPLGTAGAIKNARSMLFGDSFLAMNGDILTDLDPWRLVSSVTNGTMASIAAVPLRSPYGVIDIDGDFATGFEEKPILRNHWVNAGVYCLSTGILDALPESGNIEATTMPQLASQGKIRVTKYEGVHWRSIDTYKDIEEAQREFSDLAPKRVASKTLA